MAATLTYTRIEITRQSRNIFTLVFTLAMPTAMYLLFGAFTAYGSAPAGHANTSYYVMTSMAAYGVATAMTSLTALAAAEAAQGWGRQLALTPMGMVGYAVMKLAVAVFFSAIVVVVLFVVGALTGAKPDHWWMWLSTAGIVLGLGLIYGLFGLGVGLIFNSDSAAGLASAMLTFFGFFGNVFMPLSGTMLQIAHFTPLYGYVGLARWPQLEGQDVMGDGSDPGWMLWASVLAWAAVFALLVRIGVVRSRTRR